MALKNTYSSKPIQNIFRDIQMILANHGAKKIMYDFGDDGKIYGVSFAIEINGKIIGIKLPAQVDKVKLILASQKKRGYVEDEQAYRVSWRGIEDWVAAQCAMVDIGNAKMEQVFLPYMTDNQGKSLFEKFEQNKFLLEGN